MWLCFFLFSSFCHAFSTDLEIPQNQILTTDYEDDDDDINFSIEDPDLNLTNPSFTPEKPCLPAPAPSRCKISFVEFRAAYFYPLGKEFRSFYNGSVIWGAEANFKIIAGFSSWIAASYFTKHGELIPEGSSQITLIPLNGGFKWTYCAYKWAQPYLGAGIEFLYLEEKTVSPYLIPSVHTWDFGLHFKVGSLTQFFKTCFLDIYLDYFVKCKNIYAPSFDSVDINNQNVNYLNFGGALGFFF